MGYYETPTEWISNMHKKFATPRNFIRRNQTKILIITTATATAAAVLFRLGSKQKDEFLKEHDLYDTFYAQED